MCPNFSAPRKLTLEIRHWVARFVDPYEAKVTILSHFTIFDSIDMEGCVARCFELCRVCVIDSQADSFAAEPVANELCYVRIKFEKERALDLHLHLHNTRRLSLLRQESSPMLGKRTRTRHHQIAETHYGHRCWSTSSCWRRSLALPGCWQYSRIPYNTSWQIHQGVHECYKDCDPSTHNILTSQHPRWEVWTLFKLYLEHSCGRKILHQSKQPSAWGSGATYGNWRFVRDSRLAYWAQISCNPR